jgi:hypothetical protein
MHAAFQPPLFTVAGSVQLSMRGLKEKDAFERCHPSRGCLNCAHEQIKVPFANAGHWSAGLG